MPTKPRARCPDCKQLHSGTGRCHTCRATTTQRGLGWTHQQAAAIILTGDPLCHWCKIRPATTADHVTPRSHGGPTGLDHLGNYVPACKPCNYGRTTAT